MLEPNRMGPLSEGSEKFINTNSSLFLTNTPLSLSFL